MKIRSIHPGFFTDRRVASLPPITRILFAGLWVRSDDYGRGRFIPKSIEGDVFPYDTVDIVTELTALRRAGLIAVYEVNGEPFYHIPTWERYQSPRHRARTDVPPPPEGHTDPLQTTDQPQLVTDPGAFPESFRKTAQPPISGGPGDDLEAAEGASDAEPAENGGNVGVARPGKFSGKPPESFRHERERERELSLTPNGVSGDGAKSARSELFDAFVEVWTGRPYAPGRRIPRPERGRLNAAVRDAVDAGITADEIRERAGRYRKTWPALEFTPQALLANWSRFDAAAEPPPPVTAETCEHPTDRRAYIEGDAWCGMCGTELAKETENA